MAGPSKSDLAKLATLHKELQLKLLNVMACMEVLGYQMVVVEAKRTAAEQYAHWLKGRDPRFPGPTVTDCDGYEKLSPHQSGRAVDLAFLDPRGQPTWDTHYPWDAYGECGKALGLVWGGDWKKRDCPHLELPKPKVPPNATGKALLTIAKTKKR